MTMDSRLHRIVAAQPYPLLVATISGAHLYGFGFPSPPPVSCPTVFADRARSRGAQVARGVAQDYSGRP